VLEGKKHLYLIFFVFLCVRVLFIFFTGYDNCELCPDCNWINIISERALVGNFDFDVERFIFPPFYPCFIALLKFLLGNFWAAGLVISQLLISSISGVYFYKLSELLFPQDKRIAYLSTGLFAVFPLTLWWVHTFCTEMLFQSLLIISIYYLVLSCKKQEVKFVILSAAAFSIVFLTKSHILPFTPFIVLAYFIGVKPFGKALLYSICYAAICLSATLPFGIYNLQKHGEYVLSSNGLKFHFYTGNSEFGYISIVDVPPRDSDDFIKLKYVKHMGYFNGSVHDSIWVLPQKEKQELYLQQSLKWIKAHPAKFMELKVNNLSRFLLPGVSYQQYTFWEWLLSLLISLPVYIFGYFGIVKALRNDFKSNFFILGLFITLLLFSVIFYAQNRFRTITIEPFYILYSACGLLLFYDSFLKRK